MQTLEEMSAWTLDDVVAHTKALLPPGARLAYGMDDSVWFARIERREEGLEQGWLVLWEDQGIDPRNVLLNAYGWVWGQIHSKAPTHSPWSRKHEFTVSKARVLSSEPDPEDLDENYLKSVYGLGHTK